MSTTDRSEIFSDVDQTSTALSGTNSNQSQVTIDKYGFIGGKEYTDPEHEKTSVNKIRKSETKWLEMLDNWDKWMSKKFSKVKKRCRKGIPSSLRGRAWQLLSGSKHLHDQNKDVFQKLLRAEAKPDIADLIDRDLHRQFPFHEMFREKGGNGQQDLRDILNAYAIYDPRVNYCQAQAPVGAVLLMHMPVEEAFWCMVAIFDFYIPGYYSDGLEAVQIDGDVMQSLLRQIVPAAYKHLQELDIKPMLYATEWLMCLFSRSLPWPCLLRTWDMFFCEGVKVILRCGLLMLKYALGTPEDLKNIPEFFPAIQYLRKFQLKDVDPDVWIKEIIEIKINEGDLENEHKRQLELRQKPGASKSPRRTYKHIPVLSGSNWSTSFKQKKRINSISVNSPSIIEQTAQRERLEKLNTSTSKRSKKFLSLSSPRLRRHSEVVTFRSSTLSINVATSSLSIPDTIRREGF